MLDGIRPGITPTVHKGPSLKDLLQKVPSQKDPSQKVPSLKGPSHKRTPDIKGPITKEHITKGPILYKVTKGLKTKYGYPPPSALTCPTLSNVIPYHCAAFSNFPPCPTN
jgi:hypothetical protein